MKIVKGLPYLAVGALTFGLVGATVLAPVVNAIDPQTKDQTVEVTVDSQIGIGLTDGSGSGVKDKVTENVGAPEAKTGDNMKTTVKITSNNPTGWSLTLADKDNDTNLKKADGSASIPTAASQPTAGTASWAAKVGQDWKAIPKASETPITIDSMSTTGGKDASVSFGVATAADTAAGTYSDVVTYTLTVNQ